MVNKAKRRRLQRIPGPDRRIGQAADGMGKAGEARVNGKNSPPSKKLAYCRLWGLMKLDFDT